MAHIPSLFCEVPWQYLIDSESRALIASIQLMRAHVY